MLVFKTPAREYRRALAYGCRRYHQAPLIRIPKDSAVYAFGAANKRSEPLFETKDLDWTVHEQDSWGIVGRGKSNVFQTLLGHTRIHPVPEGGLYPSLKDQDPFTRIKFVPFRHSNAVSSGESGGFYDYTAKYGALREGDDKTLESSLREAVATSSLPTAEQSRILDSLELTPLLQVPLIGLSNGQMRRARIAKALFKNPTILLLDEPLTGLDVESRQRLTDLFKRLRTRSHACSPHVISSFRVQEIVSFDGSEVRDVAPKFLTHLLFSEGDRFWAGKRQDFFEQLAPKLADGLRNRNMHSTFIPPIQRGRTVAHLRNVSVKYGPRQVLDDIDWEIKQGDRWHLQGSNGSGKTTLLSLLTGDHPQSYTQAHLKIPSVELSPEKKPHEQRNWRLEHRKRTATPHLQSLIGVLSPELFDAFPRRYPGMSVWDAIQTGFSGTFISSNKPVGDVYVDTWEEGADSVKAWRIKRCWEVLEHLGPQTWGNSNAAIRETGVSTDARSFAARSFTSLTQGEQRMVLLMRALVGRPPLVILDEVWSGMDERMIKAVKAYFDSGHGVGNDQAVILVTHWDSEVPWTQEQGLRKFRLEHGRGHVVA
ncbi:ATP-binding cassette transporter [Coprinopsis cinerea AmutBmut pab1-1]|nr:ATP-binding cassette transporter [Coprinopsis cinerea AmutBmut pab1-1]